MSENKCMSEQEHFTDDDRVEQKKYEPSDVDDELHESIMICSKCGCVDDEERPVLCVGGEDHNFKPATNKQLIGGDS